MPANIIHIVPRLAPSIGGVADYAALLARQLRDGHAIQSAFLVGDPAWQGTARLDGFMVERIAGQQANLLERSLKNLDAAIVLLHYVGYGYQKRGCPIWLLRGLQSWKRQSPRHRLIVMFHELFATGLPWQSSFWSAPLQRGLTKALALLSDARLTNLAGSGEIIARLTGQPTSSIPVLPVFSTVGEANGEDDLEKRKPHMIVFGSASWRRQAYRSHGESLARACATLGIETIVDIGAPLNETPRLPVALRQTGVLSAPAISRELRCARAGFFTYPAPLLGKSTIFAAYTAYGLIPVTYGENRGVNLDALRPEEHFLALDHAPRRTSERCTAIARGAQRWYAAHNLAKQGELFADCIERTGL
jgi:hypothetical protein